MRLRRIGIRSFRKLQGPVVLDRLGDGLTVISGDNEEGKSTVLMALKAALFEAHSVGGAVKDEMTPYGGGVPEVEVTFELRGVSWTLRKAFRRGGVELAGGGERWRDDEAEQRLVELLRFERRSGRGERRPTHLGLTGLFWLDQGTTFEIARKPDDDPLAPGRGRLAAAVADEVGAAAGGEGVARLIATVRKRADPYWTPQWQEKGAIKEARTAISDIISKLEDLRRRAEEQADRVERLDRLYLERRRAAEGDAVSRARAKLDEMRRQVEGLGTIERGLEQAAQRLATAEAETARLHDLEAQRAMVRADIDRLARRDLELAARHEEMASALATRRSDLVHAEHAEHAAASVLLAADTAQREIDGLRQAHKLHRMRSVLERARAANDAAAAARAAFTANRATAARLRAVTQAEARRQAAGAALEAAATTLEITPEPGRAVHHGGVRLEAGQPLRLTERTVLDLDGFGRMVVTPGGSDIAERRSMARTAEEELRAAMVDAGAATVADAERQAVERQRAEAKAIDAETRRDSLVLASGVDGVDALAVAVAALEETVGRAPGAADPPDEAEVDARQRATLDALAEAAAHRDAARAATKTCESALFESTQSLALVEQERQATGMALVAARARSTPQPGQPSDEELVGALAEADSVRLRLLGERDAKNLERRHVDPATIREKQGVAERELRAVEADRDRLYREILILEAELRSGGDDGLGERIAEREAELAAAESALARTLTEAGAWRLLHHELTAAVRSTQEALLAPVVRRLSPWLGRLLPDVVPMLDPVSLAPVELRRGQQTEMLGQLSIGTREQIAVLVRLGLAQLLKEREGEAPCLILDDALVYADEARFDTMKAILQRAAQELQIIILTCRPRDYAGLQGRHLHLRDCLAHGADLAAAMAAD